MILTMIFGLPYWRTVAGGNSLAHNVRKTRVASFALASGDWEVRHV